MTARNQTDNDLDDYPFRGGQVWESPSYNRHYLVYGKDAWVLSSLPSEQGNCAYVEHDGKWIYSTDELVERLKDCKLIGKFHEIYIEQPTSDLQARLKVAEEALDLVATLVASEGRGWPGDLGPAVEVAAFQGCLAASMPSYIG